MLVQIMLALHQRLCMRVNRADALRGCPRNSHQTMPDREDLLPDDVILKFKEEVIILRHDSCRGILNRKHRIVCRPLLNCAHRIAEGLHMEVINVLPEELLHGRLGIRSGSALISHSRLLSDQRIHRNKRKSVKLSRIIHQAVLALPADCHNLLIKLAYRSFVEIRARKSCQCCQLLLLSFLVQNPFAGMNLILCNLLRNGHPLLEELHNLCVNFIQLLSVFQKPHTVLSPCPLLPRGRL